MKLLFLNFYSLQFSHGLSPFIDLFDPFQKKDNKNKDLDRGAMWGAMFFIAPLTATLRP